MAIDNLKTTLYLLLLASTGYAQTNDEHLYDGIDYRWYWNTNLGIVVPDDDLRLNEAKVLDLRVGKNWNENWGFEMELMRDEYDFNMDFDLKHYSAAVNFIYTNHDPLWKPYLLVGVGAIRADSRLPQEQSRDDVIVNIAIGGSWYFFGNGVRLRVEARSRLDSNDSKQPGQDGFGDGQFTLGIVVPIGD